jgi:hypothetical protein
MATRTVKILEHSTPSVSDDVMLCQLNMLPGQQDFCCGLGLLAALEVIGIARLNEVDRLALGRLMVSAGHSVTLTCRVR